MTYRGQMNTLTIGNDTWGIADGSTIYELEQARTGYDETEYETVGDNIRESDQKILDEVESTYLTQEDAADTYAAQDGYYELLTSGAADNLTGRGDGVGAEYTYRTAGGDADIADGVARIESIKGNTLVWNQLAQARSGSIYGVTFVKNDDKSSGSYSGTASTTDNLWLAQFSAVTGHKYYYRCDFDDDNTYFIRSVSSANERNSGEGYIITYTFSNAVGYFLRPVEENAAYDVNFTAMFFDLTRMFGAGNEPATVEEFESLFPESYYPYDAGSLLNVNMEGVRTVGFNQWDEEWEVGGIVEDTGQNQAVGDRIRCKDYIPVFPSTEYYMEVPVGTAPVFFYDENKNYITPYYGSVGGVFTTPSNARYMRFRLGTNYGTAYNNDICINLSWSGYRNGEYEEYWQQEREIDAATYFPDGMKSAGSVYDELTATKAIQRVGVVDLGTLDWAYDVATTDHERFASNSINSLIKLGIDSNENANLKCATLITNTANQTYLHENNNAISANRLGQILVYASAYTDTATFKAAMSGVMLYYELATPIETDITPELSLTYKVSDFGTEEIMVDTTQDAPQTAPVPMQIVYGLNAVDTIRRLPVNYISHASFLQFLSAIESHFDVTITETYDSDNERYTYQIAENEGGEE